MGWLLAFVTSQAFTEPGPQLWGSWGLDVPVPRFSKFDIRAAFLDRCISQDSASVCLVLAFDFQHDFPEGTVFRLALSQSKADFLSIYIHQSTAQEAVIMNESKGNNVVISWVTNSEKREAIGFPGVFNINEYIRVGG